MKQSEFAFGGGWTAEKLTVVRKYLTAYTTALKNQPFRLAYIDAFAGTGQWRPKRDEQQTELLFPELVDEDWAGFRKGSMHLALEVRPRFDEYFFIEKDPERCAELRQLVTNNFAHLEKRVEIVPDEANRWLTEKCRSWDRKGWRAVLFLDPCGMQVEWTTIEMIAETHCIDMWYLFPLGVGVNRLLKKDGDISRGHRERLNRILGSTEWYNVFYETVTHDGLFGDETRTEKVDNPFQAIENYFVSRLEEVFAGVAQNPLQLLNSVNNPIYLLCFAVGNSRGVAPALRIADHILGS